ncbi:DUF1810 domain-containing protein [Lichenihabitans sp. Uapishka_5]|uniref:DUF1810 domain-containing protein n=1 Tax=Lichenihabitans sp. Uapishka_5 TaxID=3037302 RepID=UPI0029E816F4|nr:DUF1810 domain-containing protein [Lichenihabitans sp. Uapishka_5]MDX7950604.1 DUF1810 domain-containing protein [Lichenihabitans sp. Uapishka_5]
MSDPGDVGAGPDPHGLERFVAAQALVIDEVLDELRRGRKASHWMWFVFPQIAGLGHSAMAQRYAIASAAEARAYLAHPVLGRRLFDATALVNGHAGRSASAIFGAPDDIKFRSSMTLFAAVAPDRAPFQRALRTFFDARPDPQTLARLASA